MLGLLATAGLAVAAWQVNEDNEDRLISRRTREAAAVLSAGNRGASDVVARVIEVTGLTPVIDVQP